MGSNSPLYYTWAICSHMLCFDIQIGAHSLSNSSFLHPIREEAEGEAYPCEVITKDEVVELLRDDCNVLTA